MTRRLGQLDPIGVQGVFYRHAAPNRDAFAGGVGGRWGADLPIIYLGRPETAPIIEAYRHLVDSTGIPARAVRPRVLYIVDVDVHEILDLTAPSALAEVGLTEDHISTDVDDYVRCQEVGAAAHERGLHGILAPASHGLGETLALFRDLLEPEELPVVRRARTWNRLPADPRVLRSVGSRRSQRSEP